MSTLSVFAEKLRAALQLPCKDKCRYATLEMAQRFALKRTKPSARDRAKFLQPYACAHCGGFHLTSRPYRDKVEQYPVIGDWTG